MRTLREKYFSYKNQKIDYISESDIRDLLIYHCGLKSYTELTIHFDDEIINEEKLDELFEKLKGGAMIQYTLGSANFLGEKFIVNESVLIPRQETEQLVCLTTDLIKYNFDYKNIEILDLCCGSGVIGITLKREFPHANVCCSDISEGAINVLKQNMDKFRVNIEVEIGDFLNPIILKDKKFDVIVCNPPYIDNIKGIDKRTWEQEPHIALLANPSTKYYEELISNLNKITKEHFLVALEIGEDMEEKLTQILKNYQLQNHAKFEKDIYGKTRFLFIMK